MRQLLARRSTIGHSADAALTGRQVLWILIGFFGSVFAVNGWFVYDALSTYSGDVGEGAYTQGLAYNRRIAADERQSDLDWHAGVDVVLPSNTQTAKATITLADGAGAPLTGRVVSFTIGRPATSNFDHSLTLAEVAPGVYSGKVSNLTPGAWIADAEIMAHANDKPEYRLRRRLWLKP